MEKGVKVGAGKENLHTGQVQDHDLDIRQCVVRTTGLGAQKPCLLSTSDCPIYSTNLTQVSAGDVAPAALYRVCQDTTHLSSS